jgi:hypothetical protein
VKSFEAGIQQYTAAGKTSTARGKIDWNTSAPRSLCHASNWKVILADDF